MDPQDKISRFEEYRSKMNEIILGEAPLEVQRLFSLDSQAYRPGVLEARTKELMGLACSLVLRCDDCATYHIVQATEAGASDEEIWETMSIALIVGGSVVIPHLRRAVETLKAIRSR